MKKLFILIPIFVLAGLLVFNSPIQTVKTGLTSVEKAAVGEITVQPMSDPGGW